MIAVGLAIGVPVSTCRLEGVPGITYFTDTKFMDVETVRPNGFLAFCSRPIGRKAADLDMYFSSARDIYKENKSRKGWGKGTSLQISYCGT